MLRKLMDKKVSRRAFIKGGAAFSATVTALLAGLPMTGCRSMLAPARGRALADGEWIPAACWHNCGGSKCVNKALVVDGVVIRQKTDDSTPDTPEAPQQRACARGFSQQIQALGADRLKYPMKRRNWQPGGGRRDLRGQDEWERISWDEAFDYIANEIKRISGAYGTESILATGNGVTDPVLTQLGPHVRAWGTISWGAWFATPHLLDVGDGCMLVDQLNDRFDLQESELCVAFGVNPAWTTLGNATNYYLDMKNAGCEFVIIDPVYSDTVAALDAEWIQSRPGTDTVFMMALCYAMLEQDDPVTNPLIDWDFLHKYSVGFDADHMPDNARVNENFKDYLLGAYDQTPKTPEWASQICGTPPETIRRLANRMGKNTKLALLTGWIAGRAYNSDYVPQLFMTLGIMGGHLGKSGHCTGVSTWNHAGNFGPALVRAGGGGMTTTYETHPIHWLNDTECWPAVLGEPFNPTNIFVNLNGWLSGVPSRTWKDWMRNVDLTGRVERINPNIQMIWHSNAANLQTRDGTVKGIQAHRSVEFVVSQNSHLTTNAKYSDIVLPVTTMWEREGMFMGSTSRDVVIIGRKVINPLFESKSDEEIMEGIAPRLGLDPAALYPLSPRQRFFNALRGTTVVRENGVDFEPLLTITRRDIRNWGVQGSPQRGRIPLRQLLEDGKYQVMRHKGDNYGFIAYKNFIDDPENNPLYSTTGKFEIYSQTLADVLNSHGFDDHVHSPIPKYRPPINGFESTFTNFAAGTRGPYPYQLINVKYQRRAHSIFDHIPWLREAFVNPFFISAADAREKGISDGDFVLITSAYGRTVRPAYVTERFMPGVCSLPHGAWVNVDEATGIDKAGADNYIFGNHPNGQGISGWTTQIVNFERWTGAPLVPDKDLPLRIIF